MTDPVAAIAGLYLVRLRPTLSADVAPSLPSIVKPATASALATLSAAYAETGRFDDAVAAIDRGIAAAEAAGDDAMAKKLRNRRELYAAKKPYRDVSSEYVGPE